MTRKLAFAMAAGLASVMTAMPLAAQDSGRIENQTEGEMTEDSWDPADDPQVRVCPDGKYESGCDREDIANSISVGQDTPIELGSDCLFQTKARCFPLAYGVIPPTVLGGTITWQKMEIFPQDGPRVEMLVMTEAQNDEPVNVLVARQTEGWYGVPDIIDSSSRLLLLHAPGRTGGSGAGNVDVVLTKHAFGWTTFDVNTYLEQAAGLLPEGFELGRGASFNFREMFASVPVSRPLDGGCCSTGGMAYINLGLPRPNWMQVESITFEETNPVKTHRIEATEDLVEYEDEGAEED